MSIREDLKKSQFAHLLVIDCLDFDEKGLVFYDCYDDSAPVLIMDEKSIISANEKIKDNRLKIDMHGYIAGNCAYYIDRFVQEAVLHIDSKYHLDPDYYTSKIPRLINGKSYLFPDPEFFGCFCYSERFQSVGMFCKPGTIKKV